ncbi:MAG: NAD(P)-dependent oxidoreductase [Gammaproteobacteria bacterium]|nr:NAD(P)-dependent oxidoreductase [Gammaproteobacteria bacterium]
MNKQSLKNKVILITGASRGIGREIAVRCAQEGANIVVLAKTSTAHPTLEGTIFSTAEKIEKVGGKALPLAVDVRDETAMSEAVDKAVETFGGIDIVINNASALNLDPSLTIPMKRFDLIFAVNVRATFMCSRLCIPHLKKSANPHILNLSPPLNMKAKWFKNHLAYTMSKYGMSMCTLGMAEEFKRDGIAVNSLWPKTLIATAAVSVNFPKPLYEASRKPSIMADAALEVITSDSRIVTGNFFIDETLLKERGISDFSGYALKAGGGPLYPDLYIES